jgi:hypothetical protein
MRIALEVGARTMVGPSPLNHFPSFQGRRRIMTERVREILSWYSSDNPGTLTNLPAC